MLPVKYGKGHREVSYDLPNVSTAVKLDLVGHKLNVSTQGIGGPTLPYRRQIKKSWVMI